MLFSYKDKPIKVYGLPDFEKNKLLRRLPEDICCRLEEYPAFLGRRISGSRIGFRTNSKRITVRYEIEEIHYDSGMSVFSSCGAFLYTGSHKNPKYLGMVVPSWYDNYKYENTFYRDNVMDDILIYLSRNEIVKNIEIEIDDDAKIEEPTPYVNSKPVLYYGSSITEGGCASISSNSYPAIISRHLDLDYYNYGFGGGCRGELFVADYLNTIDCSAFVYDYDHNAPDVNYLEATHEPFFKRIREAHPNLPILIISKPQYTYYEDDKLRREVIKRTYRNARANGDRNVYFIDGEELFNGHDRDFCTNDGTHPNDFGFYRMAEAIEPYIKKMLNL